MHTAFSWILMYTAFSWILMYTAFSWILMHTAFSWILMYTAFSWILMYTAFSWILMYTAFSWILMHTAFSWILMYTAFSWILMYTAFSWILMPTAFSWILMPTAFSWILMYTAFSWILNCLRAMQLIFYANFHPGSPIAATPPDNHWSPELKIEFMPHGNIAPAHQPHLHISHSPDIFPPPPPRIRSINRHHQFGPSLVFHSSNSYSLKCNTNIQDIT